MTRPSWVALHSLAHGFIELDKAMVPVGFPGGSEVKASARNAGDPGLIPGSGRSPGEGNGNVVSLPGKSHGQRSLGGYCPWGRKRVGHNLAIKQQQNPITEK